MMTRFTQGGCVFSILLLAACGGGGGAVLDEPESPFGGSGGAGGGAAAGPVVIQAVVLDSSGRTTGAETGTFDADARRYVIGGLAGDIDADGEVVTLDGGGLITITPGPTEFAAAFVAEPAGANRLIGVVGVETVVSDLPGGTATFNGSSELTVVDGSDLFTLTGDAVITADFAGGTVTTTVDGLSGTVSTGGATAPQDVTDVATITFAGSGIAGATFAGGVATVDSDVLTPLSGAEVQSLNGAFFGPGADEAGATFLIDDAASGGVTVFGTAIAD